MIKILIVARAVSVHVGRWIQNVSGTGLDIHLFDADDIEPQSYHALVKGVTAYHSIYYHSPPGVKSRGLRLPVFPGVWVVAEAVRHYMRVRRKGYWHRHLAKTINRLKPDVIHIIGFQHAGYLFLEAQPSIDIPLPPIIVTNYGNDIYLFHRLPEHAARVRRLLQLADVYDSECDRDVQLARELGFRRLAWPVFPNAGGLDLPKIRSLRQAGLVSQRSIIMIKGYQGWAGRAMFVLKALEAVSDLLQEMTVVLFSVQEDTKIAAWLLQERTGINVKFLPQVSHDNMLSHFGQARLYISSSISDGLNTAMSEAIAMGAFPVIAATGCADEWLVDGETGLFVQDPEDVSEIAAAIRRALTDDAMVDAAAERNWEIVEQRLDANRIRELARTLYLELNKVMLES